mmetsp:Transcript_24800/g.62350  ORF Transcript_24800/g.62350 Transcript_24800/m.62350 type:complete len:271 (+) Transcript_24800:308-1120(+)
MGMGMGPLHPPMVHFALASFAVIMFYKENNGGSFCRNDCRVEMEGSRSSIPLIEGFGFGAASPPPPRSAISRAVFSATALSPIAAWPLCASLCFSRSDSDGGCSAAASPPFSPDLPAPPLIRSTRDAVLLATSSLEEPDMDHVGLPEAELPAKDDIKAFFLRPASTMLTEVESSAPEDLELSSDDMPFAASTSPPGGGSVTARRPSCSCSGIKCCWIAAAPARLALDASTSFTQPSRQNSGPVSITAHPPTSTLISKHSSPHTLTPSVPV